MNVRIGIPLVKYWVQNRVTFMGTARSFFHGDGS